MKKSMKALFMASMLPVMMLMAAVTLTSCEGMLDAIFGEWSRPTNQQNNEPTEDKIEAAQIREAVALLEEAQKEGSITTMYFTVSGTDYEATFKKVGTEFVLQELKSTKAATRAGDDLEAKLELIEVEDDGDDEGDDDDGDEEGDDDDEGDDGDDDGDDGDDDDEDDPVDGTTWYDVDDSSEGDGGAGAGTRSNEIHKVSGTRGNVPVNLGMPVASNQMMHFTVTSKTTGEMLINFHTNMGNSETMAECVTGTVSTIVHHSISVNGKTRTLGSGDKECKIMLPNGNMVILKHKNDEKWNTLIKKHKKFSATKKYVMYDRKYWVLKNGNAVKRSAKVKYINYTSSTKVSGLSLSTNVNKDEYSNNIDKNNFRKGDKIRVKVDFDTESKGAKKRDAFGIKDATSSVSVRKIEGNKNVFEIEAIEEPTGNAEPKKFSVTFTYKDYDNVAKSIIFTGYIKLDKSSDQVTAEINALYAKLDDGLKITDAEISSIESISILVGDLVASDAAETITETYAKPLAEKICTEKNLGGVVLFMGGDETNGYDFYVINGDSKSKTHLVSTAAIPETWEGLTLFYVKKSTSSSSSE